MQTPQAYCEQLDIPAASRMRLLLQLSALKLAQERGVDAVSVRDVLSRAQLGRPFYDCFDSLESLWSTAAKELNAEVFETVSPLANASLDPWARIAVCLRLHLHLAQKYPIWGHFLNQLCGRVEVQNQRLEMFLLQELRQAFAFSGMDSQRLHAAHRLAFDAISNGIANQQPATPQYAEHLVLQVLESVGLNPDKAKNLAFKRIPKPVTVGGMMFSYLSQPSAPGVAEEVPASSAVEQPSLWNRRSVSPKRLQEPAPSSTELATMLAAAMHAPDHGRLLPWRVIQFHAQDREQLASLFEEEKLRRDPLASEQDKKRAREHATRPPMLLAFVVSPRAQTTVPSSEQWLSAGAALGNLLAAAHSLGFGAMVLSGDRCSDNSLCSAIGLAPEEHLAGFISLGSVREAPPAHAERPVDLVLSAWVGKEEGVPTVRNTKPV